MKKIFYAILFALALPIFADSWNCDYNGTWSSKSETEGFSWKLNWSPGSAPGNWILTGDYDDKYGSSHLDGTCSSKKCKLTQTYQSGQLNGKVYYWAGTYSDKVVSATQTTNTFSGTWGTTANATGGGTWKATAKCNKE
ncbi:MAG: hypothetical protein SFU98_03565 [Leptospiraceae bacterium]|nr:hypothetical protein [Leptospiraceae bacterium]